MATTEEFVTLKETAERLNLHYHQLQRAAKKGLFPTYLPFGRRIYVRLSGIQTASARSVRSCLRDASDVKRQISSTD